jgi:hypothetical protein
MDVISFLHILDPFVGLTLRINHQRPTSGIAEEDKIITFTFLWGKKNCIKNSPRKMYL